MKVDLNKIEFDMNEFWRYYFKIRRNLLQSRFWNWCT